MRRAPLLLPLLLLLLSPPAMADCPTSAARADYLEGRQLLRRGDGAGAVARLTAARARCPAPAIDFYLAVAHESLGRLRLALDALDKYRAAAGEAGDSPSVKAWARDLSARADAEQQGVPPPSLPPRPSPSAPPPYVPDEERLLATPAPKPAPPPRTEDRWLFFGGLGLAFNASFQPGSLSYQDGTVANFGGSYQLGFAYRLAIRARLDLEALVAGQLLPWTRSDRSANTNVLFATLIGAGLRVDLPLYQGTRTRLWLTPSAVVGLGSLSLNVDPSYQNALGLRFAIGFTVERGAVGFFLEPDCLVLVAGDLSALQWTVALDIGTRIRF